MEQSRFCQVGKMCHEKFPILPKKGLECQPAIVTFEIHRGEYVLLSRSQTGPGRNFSQSRTNHFFLSVLSYPGAFCLTLYESPVGPRRSVKCLRSPLSPRSSPCRSSLRWFVVRRRFLGEQEGARRRSCSCSLSCFVRLSARKWMSSGSRRHREWN